MSLYSQVISLCSGLAGKNNWDAACIDMLMQEMIDAIDEMKPLLLERDEGKRVQYFLIQFYAINFSKLIYIRVICGDKRRKMC